LKEEKEKTWRDAGCGQERPSVGGEENSYRVFIRY
jgi:hypothetical protein